MSPAAFREQIRSYVERHTLVSPGERVVVGVSGGVDSIVCTHVLRRLDVEVVAAHVNYGLRDAADDDEAFVRDWCAARSPEIPFYPRRVDVEERASTTGESVQEAAREQRYSFFGDVARRVGASVVAVGHHRDDQAETLLLNLLRGTGPEGLAGMAPSRPMHDAPEVRLIRPLLDVSRADVEAYAESEGLAWHVDASNRSSTYRRGVLRTEVMPLLQKHVPGAVDNVARAASLMREYVDATIAPTLTAHMDAAYADRDPGGWLSADALRSMPPVWQRRVVLEGLRRAVPSAPHTAAVAREVVGLVASQVGRRVEVGTGAVWRERGGLRLLPTYEPACLEPTLLPFGTPVSVPGGTVRVDRLDAAPDTLDVGTPTVAFADADRLDPPLTVRTWRDGDRVHPLGMDGSKTVSTLLTDDHVPAHQRRRMCVVLSGGAVAWVVGHRLDHRVRIRPSTECYVKFTFRSSENASTDS